MRSTVFAMFAPLKIPQNGNILQNQRFLTGLAILAVSILILGGCKSMEPPAKRPAETEAKPPAEAEAKPITEPESNPEVEKAAIECARVWLELLDSGKYAESWEEAAEYVKALVNKENWQKSLQGVRQPLGKLVSREVKSTRYTTSAPGAPDGQYVIIQYNTSFENKKSAVETITPMLDKDGKWRVSGYYIR